MRSLLVLLSSLLVSDGFTVSTEYNTKTTWVSQYESTQKYEAASTTATSEHLSTSTTASNEHLYTSTETVYETTGSGAGLYTINCDTSLDNTYYLTPYIGDYSVFTVSSNRTDASPYSNNNQDCRISFITKGSAFSVYLIIDKLQLASSPECRLSYLCLQGIKFCGNWTEGRMYTYIVPANNSFTITLRSGGGGFKVRVYTYRESNDSTAYEPTGTSYATAPEDIKEFHWANQSGYIDRCGVDDIPQTTEDYSGSNLDNSGTTIYPWGNFRQVIQCEDGHYYRLRYLDESPDTDSEVPSTMSQGFIIRSYNFGKGFYGNNSSCQLKFWTGNTHKLLTIYFKSFSMEASSTCFYDSFCVKGVRYCGDWETNKTFTFELPAHVYFSISMTTDESIASTGVEVYVTFTDTQYNPDHGYYEVTGGDGSEEEKLEYSTVYEENYEDKCSPDYLKTTTDPHQYDTTTTKQPVTTTRPCDSAVEIDDHVKIISDDIDNAAYYINNAKSLIDYLFKQFSF